MGKPEFTDIMVDIETTGLQPTRAAIIQLGAVPFNYKTMEIDYVGKYKASLTTPTTRGWTDNTQEFWMGPNREVYKKIMSEARPWRDVMLEFRDYILAKPQMVFWCKGLNFDWSFIHSYYNDLDLPMPFNFKHAKDLRSFISGRYNRSDSYEPEYNRIGNTHDALDDCFSQLNLLSVVKEETCPAPTTSS